MLKITHSYGFFSCCTVRADEIVKYFNAHKYLPSVVDSSEQFRLYKERQGIDVTFDFFKPYENDISINYIENITLNVLCLQFHRYKDISYNKVLPFIKKYFTPSDRIHALSTSLMEKYAIDPSNCIGMYYRGTDKYIETALAPFSSFYTKLKEVLATMGNKHTQILLQSDSAPFLEYIKEHRGDISANIIVISETAVSNTSRGIHNERAPADNYVDIQYFFATLLILAKCQHFICSSGNCSIWAMYYRENAHNVHQMLNNVWV